MSSSKIGTEITQPEPIDSDWLRRPATAVAPDLIGCTLVRQMPDRTIWKGMIVETEAYEPNDPAMHAYRRQTQRNQMMFNVGGVAYVYLIYGMYHCLNIVTDSEGTPSAVLIRALQLTTMPPWVDPQQALKPDRVAAGPGKLCRAFKIDLTLNGTILQPNHALWLEHRSPVFQEAYRLENRSLIQTTRIGLTQGVDLPWRWYLAENAAVSKT